MADAQQVIYDVRTDEAAAPRDRYAHASSLPPSRQRTPPAHTRANELYEVDTAAQTCSTSSVVRSECTVRQMWRAHMSSVTGSAGPPAANSANTGCLCNGRS